MSNSPFEIRRIEPIEETVLTRQVEIPAHDFVKHCDAKDIAFLVRSRGYRDQIILPADFLLNLTEAPPKQAKVESSKLLLPMAFVAGVAIGVLIFGPFLMGANFAWAITAFLSLIIGIAVGWESKKKSRERWEAFFEKIEYNLNKFRNKVFED